MNDSIITDLQFDPLRGALLYNEVRYLLIRPETLIAIQKTAEERLGALGLDRAIAGELLYAGGFTGGRLSGKKYSETFDLRDAQPVEFMARMGTEIGWGKLRIAHFDATAGKLALEVESSPFAHAYGHSESGVCHLIRGVFAGLISGMFASEVEAREDECAAMGAPCCRFDIRAM